MENRQAPGNKNAGDVTPATLTPRAQRILGIAQGVALPSTKTTTEHRLIGLLRAGDSVALAVLTKAAVAPIFHHLRDPMGLFIACKHHLGFRSDKFSLYLSAEESRRFRDIRGDGEIKFGVFKID